MEEFRFLHNCRICGNSNLRKYLDFGDQPLANNLQKEVSSVKNYPTSVFFCEDCGLSQLGIVVNPEILYKNYPYRSSVSKTFQEHCSELAKSARSMFKDNYKPLVLDIASNDGCLMEEFSREGFWAMGIEPCEKLVKESHEKGLDVVCGFWDEETANMGTWGVDVVTATNVLAHVNDVKKFLRLASKKLMKNGVLIVEVPYLLDLINNIQFDTIYHEHLSYFLLKPLRILFELCDMNIFRVERVNIHGGSLRVFASNHERKEEDSVKEILKLEESTGFYDYKKYVEFASSVKEAIHDFNLSLEMICLKTGGVVGYGASAKGISLINYSGIDPSLINVIVDDTLEKQGKFTPGANIKIVNYKYLDLEKPEYIVIFAWNFADEIIKKTKSHQERGGKYIIPIQRNMVTCD